MRKLQILLILTIGALIAVSCQNDRFEDLESQLEMNNLINQNQHRQIEDLQAELDATAEALAAEIANNETTISENAVAIQNNVTTIATNYDALVDADADNLEATTNAIVKLGSDLTDAIADEVATLNEQLVVLTNELKLAIADGDTYVIEVLTAQVAAATAALEAADVANANAIASVPTFDASALNADISALENADSLIGDRIAQNFSSIYYLQRDLALLSTAVASNTIITEAQASLVTSLGIELFDLKGDIPVIVQLAIDGLKAELENIYSTTISIDAAILALQEAIASIEASLLTNILNATLSQVSTLTYDPSFNGLTGTELRDARVDYLLDLVRLEPTFENVTSEYVDNTAANNGTASHQISFNYDAPTSSTNPTIKQYIKTIKLIDVEGSDGDLLNASDEHFIGYVDRLIVHGIDAARKHSGLTAKNSSKTNTCSLTDPSVGAYSVTADNANGFEIDILEFFSEGNLIWTSESCTAADAHAQLQKYYTDAAGEHVPFKADTYAVTYSYDLPTSKSAVRGRGKGTGTVRQ